MNVKKKIMCWQTTMTDRLFRQLIIGFVLTKIYACLEVCVCDASLVSQFYTVMYIMNDKRIQITKLKSKLCEYRITHFVSTK